MKQQIIFTISNTILILVDISYHKAVATEISNINNQFFAALLADLVTGLA